MSLREIEREGVRRKGVKGSSAKARTGSDTRSRERKGSGALKKAISSSTNTERGTKLAICSESWDVFAFEVW